MSVLLVLLHFDRFKLTSVASVYHKERQFNCMQSESECIILTLTKKDVYLVSLG